MIRDLRTFLLEDDLIGKAEIYPVVDTGDGKADPVIIINLSEDNPLRYLDSTSTLIQSNYIMTCYSKDFTGILEPLQERIIKLLKDFTGIIGTMEVQDTDIKLFPYGFKVSGQAEGEYAATIDLSITYTRI